MQRRCACGCALRARISEDAVPATPRFHNRTRTASSAPSFETASVLSANGRPKLGGRCDATQDDAWAEGADLLLSLVVSSVKTLTCITFCASSPRGCARGAGSAAARSRPCTGTTSRASPRATARASLSCASCSRLYRWKRMIESLAATSYYCNLGRHSRARRTTRCDEF